MKLVNILYKNQIAYNSYNNLINLTIINKIKIIIIIIMKEYRWQCKNFKAIDYHSKTGKIC